MAYGPSELKTEILSGPLAAACAPFVTAGNHVGIAALFNDPAGEHAGIVSLPELTKDEFLTAVLPALGTLPSKDAVTQSKWDRYLSVVRSVERPIRLAIAGSLLDQAVADGLFQQAYRDTIGTRQGSYAEVKWGPGVTVGHPDVGLALAN